MEIKSLAAININELYAAWDVAFKGYARTWTKQELENMLLRRGYTADLSFGVFHKGELVSFILNATGIFKGVPTAYDTGTATNAVFRGQGLTSRLFRHALPLLREAGMQQYLLEVLQDNAKAIAIYKNFGFRVTRELDYFIQESREVNLLPVSRLPAAIVIRPADAGLLPLMESMTTFVPSWQNSFEAMRHAAAHLKIIGAFYADMLIGYGIIDPASGDIPQLAVTPEFRRIQVGTALLGELLRYNKSDVVRIINIEHHNKPVYAFLEKAGMMKQGAQYEMLLDL